MFAVSNSLDRHMMAVRQIPTMSSMLAARVHGSMRSLVICRELAWNCTQACSRLLIISRDYVTKRFRRRRTSSLYSLNFQIALLCAELCVDEGRVSRLSLLRILIDCCWRELQTSWSWLVLVVQNKRNNKLILCCYNKLLPTSRWQASFQLTRTDSNLTAHRISHRCHSNSCC